MNEILLTGGRAVGVRMHDGTVIKAHNVVSNATPHVTFERYNWGVGVALPAAHAFSSPGSFRGSYCVVFFRDCWVARPAVSHCWNVEWIRLMSAESLPDDFRRGIQSIDYTSPVTKINIAVDRLPSFACLPNDASNTPGPQVCDNACKWSFRRGPGQKKGGGVWGVTKGQSVGSRECSDRFDPTNVMLHQVVLACIVSPLFFYIQFLFSLLAPAPRHDSSGGENVGN